MKKTVIVPTDFSIESLHVVKTILSMTSREEKFDIIFLHGVHLTTSITELLFFSHSEMIRKLSNPHFDEACHVIKNKFSSQINSIRKDIFTGFTQAAFENYLEKNQVDKAFISSTYDLQMSRKNSFDLIPFIKRSNLMVDQVDLRIETRVSEKGKLAVIFANTISTSLTQTESI
ncbi:hypothetical protein WJR50_14620 [Catalinimonas sp. 4WD22]|uniref:hypothetical protein n=1 Tax=Catalinimonas locisalis TaxID=3133978 RepID=UPI0031013A91